MASEEFKDRIRNAIAQNYERQLKKERGPQRKNDKPEKEVERQCMDQMRDWGWSMQVFEAKATYDPKAQRYISQSMKQGTLDSGGSTNEGVAAWVEFKAPGKLATLRPNQRLFLIQKIGVNNFACVVDSKERLIEIHSKWDFLREHGNYDAARDYLMSMIPKEKAQRDTGPLFED